VHHLLCHLSHVGGGVQYFTTACGSDCVKEMVEFRVNDELEGIWNEAVIA
jgi:hypothetical protein